MENAPGPEIRTTARAPGPGGVAAATMVSVNLAPCSGLATLRSAVFQT